MNVKKTKSSKKIILKITMSMTTMRSWSSEDRGCVPELSDGDTSVPIELEPTTI